MSEKLLGRKSFRPIVSLTQAMDEYFGTVFKDESFWTWRVVAKLVDNIPLTEPREVELFQQCTGRTTLPTKPVKRLLLLCGRRAGKDRFESAVAMWWAALAANWRVLHSPGEKPTILLIGVDKRRGYCEGLLEVSESLAKQVVRKTTDFLEFKNGAVLEIVANDAGLLVGRSAVGVIGTEVSFWSIPNDAEVVSAAMHSMAATPGGGLLILGSSVHCKDDGVMYKKYNELWGNNNSDDLCWFAPTMTMNPTIDQSFIDEALQENPDRARADFFNIWREDLSGVFSVDEIKNAVDAGVRERLPRGARYYAQQDVADGGVGGSSFTLAIAHRDPVSNIVTLDLIRERVPPFDFHDVVAEYAQILKRYGITTIYGDHRTSEIFMHEWKRHGIKMLVTNTTVENYRSALPLIISGHARLLDHSVLKNQLLTLERDARNREKIDHPRGGFDDVAAAGCGAIALAATEYGYDKTFRAWGHDYVDPDSWEAQRPPPPPEPITNKSFQGKWWKSQPAPTASIPSPNMMLRDYYQSIRFTGGRGMTYADNRDMFNHIGTISPLRW